MTCVARLLALKKYLKTKSLSYLVQKIQKLKKFAAQIKCPLNPKSVKSKVDCISKTVRDINPKFGTLHNKEIFLLSTV